MKKGFVILFMAIVFSSTMFFSCNNTTERTKEHYKIPEHVREGVLQLREEILQLNLTPDSLLTDEQLIFLVNMFSFLRTSIVLENNQFVITSTLEDFERAGFPIYHYYLLQEDNAWNNKKVQCEEFGVSAEEFHSRFLKSIDVFFERNRERIARLMID